MLERKIIDDEILEAFNQMDPHKAPGLDGLFGIFFKENWDVVGKDFLLPCHDILDNNRDILGINDMMVVLIPKFKDPKDMANFWPIRLSRAFLRILINAIDVGHIREIWASLNGPQINFLFITNDALLFIINKTKEVEATMKILREFLKASGQ
ncbi:hypothetical protein J1N35_005505 [Gossypium stocksii]|uniref:Reverse transcriptase domain-containing protein n=1 Tax=Gossypium stocksii TaxID=47602 RepID=A0A9D4AJB9_9ROSI|nr:hypothetical protein J1N35_005505 [Gossypium stocksii]